VRILFAVESGSRASGFPSSESDYDVRFLSVRPIEAYLAVTPLRDERPIDATLDVNGWDLRKPLELMLRLNEVPIEWLTSPVRYRSWDRADELLARVQPRALTALSQTWRGQRPPGDARSILSFAESQLVIPLQLRFWARSSNLEQSAIGLARPESSEPPAHPQLSGNGAHSLMIVSVARQPSASRAGDDDRPGQRPPRGKVPSN
jgi:RNA repair pathway DNA polymerase beta family